MKSVRWHGAAADSVSTAPALRLEFMSAWASSGFFGFLQPHINMPVGGLVTLQLHSWYPVYGNLQVVITSSATFARSTCESGHFVYVVRARKAHTKLL